MNKARNTRLNNLSKAAKAFASTPISELQNMDNVVLNALEEALLNAARQIIAPLPPVKRQREIVSDISQKFEERTKPQKPQVSKKNPKDAPIELFLSRVGDELHLKTPFWPPLNYKCKEVFAGEQFFDRDTKTRTLPAARLAEVMEVLRDSFGKFRRRVILNFDGNVTEICSGR